MPLPLTQTNTTRLAVLLNALKIIRVAVVGVFIAGWDGSWAGFKAVYALLSPVVKLSFTTLGTFTSFFRQAFRVPSNQRNNETYFQLQGHGTLFEDVIPSLDPVSERTLVAQRCCHFSRRAGDVCYALFQF